MMQAMYSAAAGMMSTQRNIDVIAGNVANIGTDGYKRSRVDFKDALYNRMVNPEDNSVTMNLQRGCGALNYQTLRIYEQGAVQESDNQFDVMLEGPGFFTVYDPVTEEVQYTRAGAFRASLSEDGAFYLTTQTGQLVLNDNGEPILLPEENISMQIGPEGNIYFKDLETGLFPDETETRLAIVDFINPAGLDARGKTSYAVSENSGEPEEAESVTVLQYAREASNVNYAEEVTRILKAQRAYQFAARCLSTADQMAQICNGIRT